MNSCDLDKTANYNGKCGVTILGNEQSAVDNAAAEIKELTSNSSSATFTQTSASSQENECSSDTTYKFPMAEDGGIDWQAAARACVNTSRK